jgi:hypothetical protein
LAALIENYHQRTEFRRDFPETWSPEWLPLFDEGKSIALVLLQEGASHTAPIYGYYTENGIGSSPDYPSLTVMMAVHLEVYEELSDVTEENWINASHDAVERVRLRHVLK